MMIIAKMMRTMRIMMNADLDIVFPVGLSSKCAGG
jgi:hypothetical protein